MVAEELANTEKETHQLLMNPKQFQNIIEYKIERVCSTDTNSIHLSIHHCQEHTYPSLLFILKTI